MNPLVSILIPAYNAERFIADTIRSAKAQTWEPKEIIVVDDGSTDRTLEIAQQFTSNHVRVVSQNHAGGPAARNTAFALAQGDYIQWLDHDDLLAPDKVARQVAVVQSGVGRRTLLSSPFGVFMCRPNRARFTPTALWGDLSPTEFLVRKLEQNVFMQTSVWLVSRELAKAAGPWDATMLTDDDGEYFCRVLLASDGIRFVPEARVYWRISGTGQGSYVGRSNRKLDAKFKAMLLHISYLRTLEDSQRVRSACVKYLQNNLIAFYSLRPDIVEHSHRMIRELGGQVEVPRLSWKYSWIRALFGWEYARRAQLFLPNVKWSLVRFWDKALFRVEKQLRNMRAESPSV